MDGQATGAHLGVSANYQAVEWTPVRARVLSALYDESPLAMQCNRSSGARFPGDWSAMPATRVRQPLRPPARHCSLGAASRHHRQPLGGDEDDHRDGEDADKPPSPPRDISAPGSALMEDWGQADDMDWGGSAPSHH